MDTLIALLVIGSHVCSCVNNIPVGKYITLFGSNHVNNMLWVP